jgi:hypothetical protein
LFQDVISAVVVDKHSEISYRKVPAGGLSIKKNNEESSYGEGIFRLYTFRVPRDSLKVPTGHSYVLLIWLFKDLGTLSPAW